MNEIKNRNAADQINRKYNSKESAYETSAPIDIEKLARRIYASRTDIENIKDHLASIDIDALQKNSEYFEDVEKTYKLYDELYNTTLQFRNSLDNFINEKEYLENETTRQDILNGAQKIEDVSNLINKDKNGYFAQTILPKIQSKFTTLILEINNKINEKISIICENLKTTCNLNDQTVVNFLDEYKNNSEPETNNIDESFYQKIDLTKDNNRLFKVDSKAYNRAKALTKSPEIFDIIINDDEGNNVIITTKGRENNISKNPNNNEPIFPFIVKSNIASMGDIKLSNIKGNFDEEGKNIFNHYVDNLYKISEKINIEIGIGNDGNLYTKNELKEISGIVDKYLPTNIINQSNTGESYILEINDNNRENDKIVYYENLSKMYMEETKSYYEGAVTDNANSLAAANSVPDQTVLI